MDIILLPIELNKEKIDSRFRLVIIATQRAIDMSKDHKTAIQGKNKKITTNAILEAVTGDVEFFTGEDARMNLEKAEKLDYRRWITEKKKPIGDITELEKELKVYLHEQDKESLEDTFFFTEPEASEQLSESEELSEELKDNQEDNE